MKRFLKIVSLVLALSTVFSLALPAFAKGKPAFPYVTLGASNSNGYALHGYLTEELYANPSLKPEDGGPGLSGYRTTPDYSYPALIRDYLTSLGYEVDHDQLAQSTMRVEELRFLLDDSFTPDEYTKWRFYDEGDPGTWWFNCLDEMRADYRQSIAEADLITYDMGLNNFGVYIMNRLISGDYDADFSHIFGTGLADRFYTLRAKLHDAVESLTQGAVTGDAIGELESMVDTLAYALLGYCVHFDATMGASVRSIPMQTSSS